MKVNKKNIEKYFDRLFPIPRSITGKGYQKSLDIISEIIPLKKVNYKTGEKCFDWDIPSEWNVNEAYVIDPDGKRILDFSKNNLHLVGYSIPINKCLNLNQLKKKLHTIKRIPNAIPYVTSYYKKDWGFCISYNQYKKLKKGKYKVIINSTLKPGKLTLGIAELKGKSKKEIFFSTYLCHPSMAHNELSGPLVTAFLYNYLKKIKNLEYSIKFLFCPENIGSVAFLKRFGEKLKKNIVAGYVINCVGFGKKYYYKKTRNGKTLSDRVVLEFLNNQKDKHEIINFFAGGSDERQYSSPGFNLPIGLLMRQMYATYNQYHTSLDNKKLISFDVMLKMIKSYYALVKKINKIPSFFNDKYIAKILKGTPKLSKSKISLYPKTMDINRLNISKRLNNETKIILEILNLCDGENTLLDISNKRKILLSDMLIPVKKLIKAKYIKKI